MARSLRLHSDDRGFFRLVAEAIYSNPFSFDPARLHALLGEAPAEPYPVQHIYGVLLPTLEARLQALAGQGIDRIQAVRGEDRTLLEYAFLFKVYHDFIDEFDALIDQQIQHGDEPVAAPFSRQLTRQLRGYGFSAEEAIRYLELFYQLRRAFYFIDQALIGEAPSMRQLRHALWNNVFTSDVGLYANHLWNRMEDFSTLLLGETGTGKGSAAAAIGRSGLIPYDSKYGRFKYSFTVTFTAINLSQFPETLIESELFGHRKGAFTGAIDNYKGVFERCNPHGALFVDEIGDITIPVQIKLLNVLQERRFTPVGSHEPQRFSGRVIAATNRRLDELRRRGEFRDDFYYRLCSDVIEVPSLRQRIAESKSELEQLTRLLIERMSGQPADALIDPVLAALERSLPGDYPWPGNVRELEQAVRRILLNGEYRPDSMGQPAAANWLEQIGRGELNAQDLLSAYCAMLYRQHGTYEAVADITGLDRRTAKKYVMLCTE